MFIVMVWGDIDGLRRWRRVMVGIMGWEDIRKDIGKILKRKVGVVGFIFIIFFVIDRSFWGGDS